MMKNKISFKPKYIESEFDFSRNLLLYFLQDLKEHLIADHSTTIWLKQ